MESVLLLKSVPSLIISLIVGVFLCGIRPALAEPTLTLLDATFTEGVLNREPQNRVSTFPLAGRNGQSRLWFWFKIQCTDRCQKNEGRSVKVPIMVKWAYKEDEMFVVKRTVRLTVENTHWRTWAYKQHLKPGTWQVVIFSEQGPVCLQERCYFQVEVTP